MQWEYLVHTLDAAGVFSTGHIRPREFQDVLNQYGREGWELVSAFETASGRDSSPLVVLTFKRTRDGETAASVRP